MCNHGHSNIRIHILLLFCISYSHYTIYRFTGAAPWPSVSECGESDTIRGNSACLRSLSVSWIDALITWTALFVFGIKHIILFPHNIELALIIIIISFRQLKDLLRWYAEEFKDPMVVDPPTWFKSFILCEALVQLPFFPVAAYAFFKGWWRKIEFCAKPYINLHLTSRDSCRVHWGRGDSRATSSGEQYLYTGPSLQLFCYFVCVFISQVDANGSGLRRSSTPHTWPPPWSLFWHTCCCTRSPGSPTRAPRPPRSAGPWCPYTPLTCSYPWCCCSPCSPLPHTIPTPRLEPALLNPRDTRPLSILSCYMNVCMPVW